jgi:lipopolysaccharide transport system ATP-binding protein
LEVGTGFHGELSGRENIFLNGAILGMKRAEIRRKFDEIVAFAEVERFLDTPVKHYSSGMYVRLAFAVAAHLDPEILIVDEVLAVGDTQFQSKCLGKMESAATQGRTVLFVSHDLDNISRLCRQGILLNGGRVELQGEMSMVITRYLRTDLADDGYADLRERGDRSGNGDGQFQTVELLTGTARCSTYGFGARLTVRTTIKVNAPLGNANLSITLLTNDGIAVYSLENSNEGIAWPSQPGIYQFDVTLPQIHLFPGSYVIDLWVGNQQRARVDYLKRAITFQIIQTPDSGLPIPLNRRDGLVFVHSEWKFARL